MTRAAATKFATGEITADAQREITTIVGLAEPRDFRPLLYVIEFSSVAQSAMPVPVSERAHPLASEYLLTNLSRDSFDAIEF